MTTIMMATVSDAV